MSTSSKRERRIIVYGSVARYGPQSAANTLHLSVITSKHYIPEESSLFGKMLANYSSRDEQKIFQTIQLHTFHFLNENERDEWLIWLVQQDTTYHLKKKKKEAEN